MKMRRLGFVFLAGFLTAGSLGMAQGIPAVDDDFRRTAPRILDTEPVSTPVTPELIPAASGEEVVLDDLKGIVVIEEIDGSMKLREGVTIVAPKFLDTDEVREALQTHVGQPLTLGDLDQICFILSLMSRQLDRPLVSAVVPEQDITSGILQVQVVEATVGSVRVEGNRWFSDKLLKDQLRVKPGDRIRSSLLEEDIQWLNQNSFRSSQTVFSPGEEVGTTDLVLETQDRFPVSVYVGFEDTGNDNTGDERWLAGLNYGNLWGLGHSMNYQFTTSPDFDDSVTHSGSYSIPLPWRHTLTVFGNYSESHPDLAAPFAQDAFSWQTGIRYIVPLPDVFGWEQEVFAGFDFKRSNSNLFFGGAQVFDRTSDVNQFVLGYETTREDDLGNTRLYGSLFLSPGGWSENNKDSIFNATRAGAEADYVYARLGASRQTRLWWNALWKVTMEGQISSNNLIGSEQYSLGGYFTARGYEESEASGDDGWRISNELVSPSFSPAALLGIVSSERALDSLQFLAFWDYGVVHPHDPLPGQDENIVLSSVGPGLRYYIDRYLSVRFDYGFQLTDTGVSDGRRSSRGHVSVTLSY